MMTTHALLSGEVLFLDALDGPAAGAAWRRAPQPAWYVEVPDGGRALRYERGTTWDAATQPWVGDESWTEYRVEVEIRPEKMWAGIDFHVADDGASACNLTLFPGEDGRLAFEFSGIWGAACAWKTQPIGQRFPSHVTGSWVRLRVDVGGEVANVFVAGDAEPVASFRDLPRSRGGVRLMAYFGSALFRNLRITALAPGSVKPVLEDPWAMARDSASGVVRAWEVTDRHAPDWGADVAPPTVIDDATRWRAVPTDGRGVVDLTGWFAPDNESGAAFARAFVQAESAGMRTIRVTYTDAFTLWCNGEPVFAGPPRQWFHPDRAKHGNSRLIPDQFEVTVPVHAGRNELLVRTAVTERFGWGFWLRVVPPAP